MSFSSPIRLGLTRETYVYTLMGAVLLGVAFNSGTNLVYLVLSLLTGIYLTSALYGAVALLGLDLRVEIDVSAMEGELLAWEVEVENRGPLGRHFLEIRPCFVATPGVGPAGRQRQSPWLNRLREALKPDGNRLVPSGEPGRILCLPSGSKQRVSMRTWAPCRGEFHVRRVELYTVFPLRLLRISRSWQVEGKVVVMPGMLRPFYTAATSHEEEVDRESVVDVHRGEGLDVLGLREYLPGDPPKRIHWKVSARAGRLMLREHQQTRSARYYLFLDLDERKLDGAGASSNLEQSLRLAATLCRELVAASCESQIFLLSNEHRPSPAIFTASELPVLLRYLGALPYTRRSSIGGLLGRSLSLLEPDARVMVVLSRPSREDLESVAGIARTGYRVMLLLNARDRVEARALGDCEGMGAVRDAAIRPLVHCAAEGALV